MSDCLRIRLRPKGPWRIAPDSGERDRAGRVYHSDTVYSAVCTAMLRLGLLEEWLEATALAPVPRVRFTSLFPYQGDTYYVPAPRGLWPPPPSSKLYAKGARFIPQPVAARLFEGRPVQEDRWEVDGASQCLIPSSARGQPGPHRMALRSGAAVDRVTHGSCEAHRTACIEFAPNAGLWLVIQFADAETRREWGRRVTGALRLLADSGFGGRRSIGWGQCDLMEAQAGTLEDLTLGRRHASERKAAPAPVEAVAAEPPVAEPLAAEAAEGETAAAPEPALAAAETVEVAPPAEIATPEAPPPVEPEPAPNGWWLLSVFTPGAADAIDWQKGSYSMIERCGRVDSPRGAGELKKALRMIEEGSVLFSDDAPVGGVTDVAPEGFPHPVYRSGYAVALRVPFRGNV